MGEQSSEFFEPEDEKTLDRAAESLYAYVLGEKIYVSDKGFTELHLIRRSGRLFIAKALRPQYRGNEIAESALRKEFQIGFLIDYPSAVRTFDFTFLPEIGWFIALEYCRGSNLRELIDSGYEFSGEELKKIADTLTDTLNFLHSQGIIHRDIKPSNIIFDEQHRSVKLIDFGCADAFDQSMFKGRAGTELYQNGEFTNLPADDWYALSLTLTELADHCADKRAKKELLPLLDMMRAGEAPTKEPRKDKKKIILVMVMILLVILGAALFFFLKPEVSNEVKTTAERDVSESVMTDSVEATEIRTDSIAIKDAVTSTIPPLDAVEEKGEKIKEVADGEQSAIKPQIHEENPKEEKIATAPSKPEPSIKSEEELIIPENIERLRSHINSAAGDYYHEKKRQLQELELRPDPKRREAEEIRAQLGNEDMVCRLIISRIRHIPNGVPIDTINKILHANYRFYFREFIPLYMRDM